MAPELIGELEAGMVAVIALELPFLLWLVARWRRRDQRSSLVEDAHRLGLQQRKKRVVFGA